MKNNFKLESIMFSWFFYVLNLISFSTWGFIFHNIGKLVR